MTVELDPPEPVDAVMCVEIIRASGLLAAVNEASIWLGGGTCPLHLALSDACQSVCSVTQNTGKCKKGHHAARVFMPLQHCMIVWGLVWCKTCDACCAEMLKCLPHDCH